MSHADNESSKTADLHTSLPPKESDPPTDHSRDQEITDSGLDFHPIKIKGEPLSATIIRERR